LVSDSFGGSGFLPNRFANSDMTRSPPVLDLPDLCVIIALECVKIKDGRPVRAAEIDKMRRLRYDGQAGPKGKARKALLHKRRLAHKPLANTQSDGG
jgi:hypothetical protein